MRIADSSMLILPRLTDMNPLWVWAGVALFAGAMIAAYARLWRLRKRSRRLDARTKRLGSDILRLRQRVYAAEARAAGATAGNTDGRRAALPIEFTSQYGEDLFLWDLFEGKTDGVYIEVGAFDGHTFSVTYPFEAVGWTGVLVEAIPERYAACASRRPGSVAVQSALTGREGARRAGTATFTIVEGADGAGGEMLSFMTPSPWHQKLLGRSQYRTRTVTVPLRTMDDVLGAAADPARSGPAAIPLLGEPGAGGTAKRAIDFAVIDVEGAELEVLDGFDLERHRPRVLVVEDAEPGSTLSATAHVTRRNYTLVGRIEVSGVFVRNDEAALIERASALLAAKGD